MRILEETTALQRIGHIVRICTYHNGRDLPGIDIRRSVDAVAQACRVGSRATRPISMLRCSLRRRGRLTGFKPDVIHAHLHEGALIGASSGGSRVPVIFDYQGRSPKVLDHGFLRRGGLSERIPQAGRTSTGYQIGSFRAAWPGWSTCSHTGCQSPASDTCRTPSILSALTQKLPEPQALLSGLS